MRLLYGHFSLFFIFASANVAFAQSHSFDTTLRCGKQLIRVSVKDLSDSITLLTATLGPRTVVIDSIDSRGLADFRFPDFDKDGYRDIMLSYFGNNTSYLLYLFDPATKQFRQIVDYMNYPVSVQLKSNKKYYYSYHRAGCADWNWESDLYKIVDFKIIHLGNIYGQGCDFDVKENPQVIEIYKIPDNEKRQS